MIINISEKNFEKYSRQIMMEKIGVNGQKKIMKSSICIIGCGGLGTTTAQYLAMTGVGKILLIDFSVPFDLKIEARLLYKFRYIRFFVSSKSVSKLKFSVLFEIVLIISESINND